MESKDVENKLNAFIWVLFLQKSEAISQEGKEGKCADILQVIIISGLLYGSENWILTRLRSRPSQR
jgi:hypothetical protein